MNHPYRNSTAEPDTNKVTLPADNSYVTFHYLNESDEKREAFKKFEPSGYWNSVRKEANVTNGSRWANNFIENGFSKGFFRLLKDWRNDDIEISIPVNRILNIVQRREACTITVEKSDD